MAVDNEHHGLPEMISTKLDSWLTTQSATTGDVEQVHYWPHRAMHKAWRTPFDKHGVHLNRTGQSKYAAMLETLCKVGGQPFEWVGSKTSTLTLWCPYW